MGTSLAVAGSVAIALGMVMLNPSANAALRKEGLSDKAKTLLEQSFQGLEGDELVDYHAHMLGLGAGGTGASVNPKLLSWRYPVARLKAKIFFNSSGIRSEAEADRQYVERLRQLAGEFPQPIKLVILAFDYRRGKNGDILHDDSEFHTPSDYVLDLSKRHPEHFIPAVSVHPYDPQALLKLEAYASQGVRIVKWLPNAQGMDPSDPAIDPYYQLMAKHGMILLCHTGEESAVHSPDDQRLGNPLLLRRALDHNVRVILAHAGNRGMNEDLDNPGRQARNFDLWLRMMDDSRYEHLLFSDISAITQTIRSHKDLRILLERDDLHSRLVNGSDYPLPAIDIFIQPWLLQIGGFITNQERKALNEIRRRNPLLFDFALKRTIKHPETGAKFPAHLFAAHPGLAGLAEPLHNPSVVKGEK